MVSLSSKSSGSRSMSLIEALLKAVAKHQDIMKRQFVAANIAFVIITSFEVIDDGDL